MYNGVRTREHGCDVPECHSALYYCQTSHFRRGGYMRVSEIVGGEGGSAGNCSDSPGSALEVNGV